MKVLVTGSTGVLGRRAVPALVAAGHEVVAVARGDAKQRAAREQGAESVALDLFDADAVGRAVAEVDAVVNLATRIPPVSRAALKRSWSENDRLRRDASRVLVDAVLERGLDRYVQESITFLYADGGHGWIREDAPVDAAGVTATARTAEEMAGRVTAAGGAGVVLRFAQFVADDSGHWVEQVPMLQRGLVPFFGAHDGYESFIDIDDAASAVVAALEVPGGVYNVADDDPMTRGEHAEVLSEVLGRPMKLPPAIVGSAPPLRVRARSQRVSNRALRDASGWEPASTSMRDRWATLFPAIQRATA